MQPTLVILAAGMGSRYGGLKQVDPVGPNGATIMDYSIFDALRAGFSRVIFIIRPDIDDVFRETVGRRFAAQTTVEYVHQRLEDLPTGFSVPTDRAKPWGTGQAVLAAAEMLDGPFSVINADDFYGAGAFASLAAFLAEDAPGDVPQHAMVAYRLRDTLSEIGSVARGICRVSPDGWLEEITETTGIEKHDQGGRCVDDDGAEHIIAGDTPVSMNLWGFSPAILPELKTGFRAFLERSRCEGTGEFYLPVGVQEAMAAGKARVKVLTSTDSWFGVTHRADKERAEAAVRDMIAAGVYPERLWD
jgi:hypothetical protein